MKALIYSILLSFGMLFCIGCATRTVYVPIESESIRYKETNTHSVDTFYRSDSVFLEKRNDTVFFEKYKTIYKTKERVDTILQIDTIKVSVPVPVPIEANKSIVEKIRDFVIGALSLVAIIYALKFILRLFPKKN